METQKADLLLQFSLLFNVLLLLSATLMWHHHRKRGRIKGELNFKDRLFLKYPNLTLRQLEFAELIALGYSNTQLEDALCITDGAVRTGKSRLKKSMELKKEEDLYLILKRI